VARGPAGDERHAARDDAPRDHDAGDPHAGQTPPATCDDGEFNGTETGPDCGGPCEPCEDDPDRPPIWRIKAQKIIWNGQTKTVRFERARFEMFGFPLAFLPAFEIADPTVKQKTGFLIPSYTSASELGHGVRVPYYWALSPTYDLTFKPTWYSKQGFLAEAEWRQRFDSGEYSITIAGIRQRSPEEFYAGRPAREFTSADNETFRGMIGSKGRFQINPRWTFGWDVMAQTDKNFSRRYGIAGFEERRRANQVYLTGLNDRNYFDLRGYHFQVQENRLDDHPRARNPRQPWVLPSFDYHFTPDEPVAGGELNFTVNAQSLRRSTLDEANFDEDNPARNLRGLDGHNTRLTAEAEWKRSLIGPGGIVVTPLLHARGDAIYASFGQDATAAMNEVAATRGIDADVRSAYYRYMATAGLEVRWPVLFSTASSTHILEPTAQLFLRPNEPHGDRLGIPNEDAQSLVFDAATLFERDKFSGFDRIEGGTRANLGFRYSGDLGGGWTTNAIFGQSFHLAGRNPYADPDLVSVGAFSGLETDRSDYVGQIGIGTPIGVNFIAGARFDKDTFRPQRTDLTASYGTPLLSLSTRYSYIAAQPDYGFERDRQEVSLGASAQLAEHWRVFGTATFDIESSTLVRRGIGFAYDDLECFAITFSYNERERIGTGEVTRNIGFQISLRTLGDFGTTTGGFGGF
jgi:LPS-assembly protein